MLIGVSSPRLLCNLLTGAKTRYSVCILSHSKILKIFNRKNGEIFYATGIVGVLPEGHVIGEEGFIM